MIEKFTNQYPISKTIRNTLIPMFETEANFKAKLLLAQDEQRAENYKKVKGYMDRYYKIYIDSVLSGVVLDGLNEYSQLFIKSNKTEKENKVLASTEQAYRKTISKAFKSSSEYKKLMGKDFIREILPSFLTEQSEKDEVAGFYDFTTYFQGFFTNRENMFSDEEKSTAIGYRCINENLPKFIDNIRSYEKIKAALSVEDIQKCNYDFCEILGFDIDYCFKADHYSFFLSQAGITRYNNVIGGYTLTNGEKVKGINEYVNLYNQKADKKSRLPLLKPLFKQILSDREASLSFVPDSFESDQELLDTVKTLFSEENLLEPIDNLGKVIDDIDSYDLNGIFVKNDTFLTNLSKQVFGRWDLISSAWNNEYEETHKIKKETDIEKESKAYKAIKSFSLSEIQRLADEELGEGTKSVTNWFKSNFAEKSSAINASFDSVKHLLSVEYDKNKNLSADEKSVQIIKELLDSVKELEFFLKTLLGTGKEENKDNVFYGVFLKYYDSIAQIDRLYDKVRNYLTKKPYSNDKIKLNFENPQFLGGWDKNKEKDYRAVLLEKEGQIYLAVMDKSFPKVFEEAPDLPDSEYFNKIEYKLLPGPNKMLPKVFFSNKNIDFFSPSEDVLRIKENETFKKGDHFNRDDCHKLIDFYKDSINKHPDWKLFDFKFKETEEYSDISGFYREVESQGYSISLKTVSAGYIKNCVKEGKLYLFRIYNKDFSEYSHGRPNLHTMYFKMLFDERNLADVVYKLNGQSEMFFRYPSIKKDELTIHKAYEPVKNKNPDNQKKHSVFEYDIIKDKRYSEPKFSIHIPITMNFKASSGSFINEQVRLELKSKENQHIIGIDRGERNLLYVCVIDGKGNIVWQKSLNEIISDNGHKVDYHALLDKKEKERDDARKSWKAVNGIKEFKEGYMSQVIHTICELVVKYDAVIAMEDLNSGFKNSRIKVEKQVYQKFEKMLTDKLNYLVEKNLAPEEIGGLLHAYQLTNKADKTFKGFQNGIIFYIPPWNTSKIDPVTGFVDLLKPKYTTVEESKQFFAKFESIVYNSDTNMFEFTFDYSKFPKGITSYRNIWTLYTNGDRIITYRDKEANNKFVNKTIILTDSFKSLFDKYGIDYKVDLQKQIINNSKADFHKQLKKLLSYTLQMRNSETGNVDVDYMISPVKDSNGDFYDSRYFRGDSSSLPENADANGAYNIARKALWAVNKLKETPDDEIMKAKLSVSNKEWLEFLQKDE